MEMGRAKVLVLLFVNVLQLVALCVVLVGLIGTKKVNNQSTPVPESLPHGGLRIPLEYEATADRIAVVVIDAMRVDFLLNFDMPFLSSLLEQGSGCAYVCNVKTPTVTLPRIKALVTGDISSYWDVIQNFYSNRLTQDNFIHRAKQERNKTLVFYGDDTWTKLFPDSFDRAEGVSSFYVTDFTEVDWNVTRHLDRELLSADSGQLPWDLLTLHFLGLDHIGHVHGLRQPTLIQTKLHEMDAVLRRVFHALQHHADSASDRRPSYLILTGDHGMANIGGHGSNSKPEVTTPFVLFSTSQMQSSECRARDGDAANWPEIEQVDVATTLSLLWGLSIPIASLGKLVKGFLPPSPQLLAALHYNMLHLHSLLDEAVDVDLQPVFAKHAELLSQPELRNNFTATAELVETYHKQLTELSARATAVTVGEQNLFQILIGLAILVACLAFNFSQVFAGHERSIGVTRSLLLIHLLAPVLIYFSSSFVEEEHYIRHYLWCACLAAHFLRVAVCEKTEKSEKRLHLSWKKGASVLGCLALHRVSSAWNSTGQKWTHLPSISNEITPTQTAWLVFGCTLPLILGTQWWRGRRRRVWMLPFGVALLLVMLVKHWTSETFFGFHNEALERLALVVVALHALLGGGLLRSWVLLTTLLHRFASIPLVAFQLVQLQLLENLSEVEEEGNETWILLGVWFGWTSFFYQGNSNNLATVDVSAGYIGQASYNPAVVATLIFANIFSAPTLQLLHFRDTVRKQDPRRVRLPRSSAILMLLFGYNAVVYTLALLIFRQHLFIWSVFTPKLLYVIGYSLLNCVITPFLT